MENLSVDMSRSAMAQGSIASRFESQTQVDEAKERKEKEWKEAYARIGQEAPQQQEEPVHDGRTLYERLQEAQAKNDEEWETRLKLGNQFRGLHEDEFQFLSAEEQKKVDREKAWREDEKRELMAYREQLAAKTAALEAASETTTILPTISSTSSTTTTPTSASTAPPRPKIPPKGIKKDVKSLMKGVVVKKKPKPAAAATAGVKVSNGAAAAAAETTAGTKRPAGEGDGDGEEARKAKK